MTKHYLNICGKEVIQALYKLAHECAEILDCGLFHDVIDISYKKRFWVRIFQHWHGNCYTLQLSDRENPWFYKVLIQTDEREHDGMVITLTHGKHRIYTEDRYKLDFDEIFEKYLKITDDYGDRTLKLNEALKRFLFIYEQYYLTWQDKSF